LTKEWTDVVRRSPIGAVTPEAARVSQGRSIARVTAPPPPFANGDAPVSEPAASPLRPRSDTAPLHLTNGDAPVPEIALAASVEPADVLPWRDALHDGPVPGGLAHSELARVRAAHLAGRGWTSEPEALRSLLDRDERLAAHPAGAEVVLWFEDDLYDELQLAQVADRLAGRPGPVTLVALPHGGRGALAEALAPAFAAREPFESSRDAFAALTGADPRAWADHGRMARLREELPDTRTGLSRLETEILEVLAAGPLGPHELFLAVAEREQPPWLGDTSVWAAAADLGDLATRRNGAFALTDAGRAVLAGDATREPHDHWIGGVHLVPGEPGWAWDATAGEPVRTA
jgi:hypothetical protein